METVIAIVIGVGLGVLLTESRIPRVRVVPLIASGVVGIVGFALDITRVSNPLLPTLAFVAAVIVASVLYAGVLWTREGVDPTATYWDWVIRELSHPRYGRDLYREEHESAETITFSGSNS